MRTLIYDIHTIVGVTQDNKERLLGKEMGQIGCIKNAWLLIDGDRIADYGTMDGWTHGRPQADMEISAAGGMAARLAAMQKQAEEMRKMREQQQKR